MKDPAAGIFFFFPPPPMWARAETGKFPLDSFAGSFFSVLFSVAYQ